MSKSKIVREKEIIRVMISLYCNKKHGKKATTDKLCDQCQALFDYAKSRLDCCKYGNQKGSCNSCPIHCYKPSMRTEIKKVMRYSGMRMIFHHPIVTIKHYMGY